MAMGCGELLIQKFPECTLQCWEEQEHLANVTVAVLTPSTVGRHCH